MNFTHQETKFDILLDIRSRLPEFLSGNRLHHTLCVENEAVSIAKQIFPSIGIDGRYLYDISAAALLHDITKQFDQEKQQQLCREHGLEYEPSPTLHAKTGAFFARDMWHINDYVFSAISYHTTGKQSMNIFEKIIFIADYIEKSREVSSCIQTRKYFWENIEKEQNKSEILDKAILLSLEFTIEHLNEKGAKIDNDSIEARDFLLAEYALRS